MYFRVSSYIKTSLAIFKFVINHKARPHAPWILKMVSQLTFVIKHTANLSNIVLSNFSRSRLPVWGPRGNCDKSFEISAYVAKIVHNGADTSTFYLPLNLESQHLLIYTFTSVFYNHFLGCLSFTLSLPSHYSNLFGNLFCPFDLTNLAWYIELVNTHLL